MKNTPLSEQFGRLRAEQKSRLECFLSQPAVACAIVAPAPISPRVLASVSSQRVYNFAGRSLAHDIKTGAGDKRANALIREAMVRICPGIDSTFVLTGNDGFQGAAALLSAFALLENDLPGDNVSKIDFQFELTSVEARELAEYMRWLGSVRPASDLVAGREVGARPHQVAPSPHLRRIASITSSAELSQKALMCAKEASSSVWLTASSIRKKGFVDDLAQLARQKELSIRCMIDDINSAQELARAEPAWEIFHCPGMTGHSLLVDAVEDATAIVGSINWMGAPIEQVMALALPFSVDDPRIGDIRALWANIAPLCRRVVS